MSEINEALRDDAAAFVLGAMSELEREAFRVKMMRDCELGRYAESLESVGDALLMSAAPLAAPDELRVSILDEARRDLAAREIIESPRAGAAPAERRGFGSRILRPVALGLAVIVLAVGAFAVGGGFESDPQNAPLTASFAAPDVPGMSGGVKTTDDGAVVTVGGMSSDLDGDVYQLWVQHGDQVYAEPVFSVSKDGSGHAFIDRELSKGDVVMITREPAGGSKEPTGEALASAQV